MSFDWVRYLTLAQELAVLSKEHTNREALQRCVISRAYYAAFCKARNYLREVDKDQALMDQSPHVHQLVIDRFEGSNDATRKDIGTVLRRLRTIRNVADYQDNFRKREKAVVRSLKHAETVVDYLNQLRF